LHEIFSGINFFYLWFKNGENPRDKKSHTWVTFPDPRSHNGNKRGRGGGEMFLSYLFCILKFYKIENYFIFEQVNNKV
jgi:hypothetical protein